MRTIVLLLISGFLFILSMQVNVVSGQPIRLSVADESKIDFSVSPNPATERISISSRNTYNLPLQIRFFTVTGNLIKQIELENYQKEEDINIEVSELTRGLYFVEFRSGPHSLIKKVVLR
ncbi:MAG: T9SS type A sorting domain-containing protein [Cyclobacteriaceae bacterium]|nr:T9SS type A sorting domain-containing protein [Cyclobacteriaceae bacterium]